MGLFSTSVESLERKIELAKKSLDSAKATLQEKKEFCKKIS